MIFRKKRKTRKLRMSDLARWEEKLALRLLLPALIIIALIAFYPLADSRYSNKPEAAADAFE